MPVRPKKWLVPIFSGARVVPVVTTAQRVLGLHAHLAHGGAMARCPGCDAEQARELKRRYQPLPSYLHQRPGRTAYILHLQVASGRLGVRV